MRSLQLFAVVSLLAFFPAKAEDDRSTNARNRISSSPPGSVIFIGDSVVQYAPLPSTICGRTVVNAGVGGVTVDWISNVVQNWFAGSRPSLVILAAGVNDAIPNRHVSTSFRSSYAKIIRNLVRVAPVIVVAIAPIKPGPTTVKVGYDPDLIPKFNEAIKSQAGIIVVDETERLSSPVTTTDGIHFSREGYAIWLDAIRAAAAKAIECR